jgi:adenylosuccinate lyase
MSHYEYQSPLNSRYASREMLHIFSSDYKYILWRKLWVELARAQKDLGLKITSDQISQMERHLHEIDYTAVSRYEEELRHDVMAHIHAFGDQCPSAKPIIHLGATSCFVTDNGDLIQLREALQIIGAKLLVLLQNFSNLALKYRDTPCLGYTHFQPAQPTTFGKRVCLWAQDFWSDATDLVQVIENLPFLGIKGATGTQASLLSLFKNDIKAVEECDQKISNSFGFKKLLRISGQTYPRKIDVHIGHFLTQLSLSAYKFANDLRLLCHTGEVEEPTLKKQVGSSAMPYKRNPIYSERVCSLARFVKNTVHNLEDTAAHQWLERSLDDSANRRIALPECFLATDALLKICIHLSDGMVINKIKIQHLLNKELPFLATENLLMNAVQKGKDRQEIHELIRHYASEVKMNLMEMTS